jgi:excisionase family DNA binding protein
MDYNRTILISIPISDLQTIIYDCVNIALKNHVSPNSALQIETDRWFDIKELCSYLPDKPARATIYSYVHKREIPFHKGKSKLRFLKSEIDAWLIRERRLTVSETETEADNYIKEHSVN